MQYHRVRKGVFLARPNRFLAQVELAGETVISHVKNTGRCRELLVPGATVYLEEADNPQRKTKYDLVVVEKGPQKRLINMDAQAPNAVFRAWAEAGHFQPDLTLLRPETVYGASRFDFYWQAVGPGGSLRRGFVEVKGVTLEEDGHAYFPDAPTVRGVKHIEELLRAKAEGYEATLCFVIQMAGMTAFSPNDGTQPAFGEALRRARDGGVTLLAYGCDVTPTTLTMAQPVNIVL